MDCSNCGAPLPAKSNICGFCNTLNDTDLRARRVVRGGRSDRHCPRCRVKMRSVDVKVGGGFLLERCDKCMGIFFDPGELESVLDDSVASVHEIDLERLTRIKSEEAATDHTANVAYLSCPVCSKLMHRRNYGRRSGVVVDTCKEHGVWLDGGELRQLTKWMQAGGRLHADQRKADEQRAEERSRRQPSALDARLARMDPQTARRPSTLTVTREGDDGLAGVLDFVRRLLD